MARSTTEITQLNRKTSINLDMKKRSFIDNPMSQVLGES
jgi:hypothetical protein